MTQEASIGENAKSERKDNDHTTKLISVHELRHIVDFDQNAIPNEDLKCCSSPTPPPRQPPTRRISRRVSQVQRRISVKELRHIVEEEDEEESPTPTACNGHHGKKKSTEDAMSANQLFGLIEKRTNKKRKSIVKKFISALTLHGYAQFYEAKGVRKVLWAAILTAMLAFIVRLTYLSYRAENYYKQVMEFEMRRVKELDFPTITVCSYLPVYTDEMLAKFPVNITEKNFKRFYYEVMSNRGTKKWTGNRSEAEKFESELIQKLQKEGYSLYSDVLGLFEKQDEKDINSEFVEKVMKGEKCVIENKPCDFKTLFKTVYRHKTQSLCKQFNSYEKGKHGLVSTGNDRENGLSLFWDISGATYFHDTSLNGLLMEIHPYGTPHHIIDHRRSVYLEPGFSTNIDIEEVMTKRLPKPFKPNCEEQERQLLKAYPYSKAVCELECFLEKAMQKCGCVPDQFVEYADKARQCNTTEMKCIFETSSNQHCHECPVQCVENDYKVSTSRLGIGNDWVYNAIRHMKGWENKSQTEIKAYIGQNIVGFRIGFVSLDKQVRTYKEAVPWYERISMLGGIMGLLLGFSVITGFEFIFFLFDYLYITIRYRCTREYLSAVLRQESILTPMQLKRKWTSGSKQTDGFEV